MTTTTDRSPQGPRLPQSANGPSRGMQVLQGLLALAATLAVVIGVPLLLLAAFGTPWPDDKPSLDWLTAPSSTEAVLGILAGVVWLAWAHFVVCLAVEAVAERKRRGLAPRVPGGGVGTQALARRAVVTIALLAGTAAGTIGSASAAIAPTADHVTAATTMSATTGAVEAVGAVGAVGAGGVLGTTVHRSSQVQHEVTERGGLPDSAELVAARSADPEVATYYEVHPPEGRNYDTLWDIAERYLDGGIRYKEIWQLNKGLTQPDGRVLRDADLIQPGWVLRLPNDAKGPGLKVVDHAAESLPGAGEASAPISATVSATVDGSVGASTDGGAGAAGGTDVSAPASTGAADGAAGSAAGTHDALSRDLVNDGWAPLFGVGGGLALAGAFLALRRRRASLGSRQLWTDALAGGRPDPTDPTPDGDGPGPGARLRDEADVDTARWLDRALRSFGTAGAAAPVRAWVGSSGIALAFEEEPDGPVPAPWTSKGTSTWVLARDADVTGGGVSGVPGLVCAGRRDDGTLLMVDPESVRGIVALAGDDRVARGVAMSMAADTATHPWADARTVTLVGFADDLAVLGTGNVRRTDDLGRVLEGLDNLARYQRGGCRRAGADSARRAREVAPETIHWDYQLVLCSGLPTADELARLRELAADARVALGVVIVGEVPDPGLALTARRDGRLVAPLHGIDVTAQVLSAPATRALVGLFDAEPAGRSVSLDQLAGRVDAEGAPAAADRAPVQLGILGPVTLSAPGEVDDERRTFLTELACFLALHPGGVHANRISAALWPRGVDPAVRDKALRQLAAWLGSTPDGAPVLSHAAGVWQLAPGAVALDWDRFRAALNAAADRPAAAEEHLRQALATVRGLPFEGVPSSRYSWLESLTIPADMALAVVLTTLALAEKAAAREAVDEARSALRDGLRLVPASEELWSSWLQLEASLGDRETVRDVADRMYAAIAEHGSPVGAGPQTDALVDALLPGYRSHVA